MIDTADAALGSLRIGVVGAGHLGRAIARRLLDAGVPRTNLALCHAGSSQTRIALIDAGLGDLVVDCHELASRAQLVLFAVRPQDRSVIGALEFDPDALFVSFLAGTPLDTLPVTPSRTRKVRMMTSTPDTLLATDAIAAAYPSGNDVVNRLCRALGARMIELASESEFSAFTALGPCLPVALTVCEGLGRAVDEAEIVNLASAMGLSDWSEVVRWARARQPVGLTPVQRDSYVEQACTRGGVTEAVVQGLKSGRSLPDSLQCGVARSDEMAESWRGFVPNRDIEQNATS